MKEPETKRTDKELLGKGIQRMAIALIFMFISPVIIYSSFKNQEHPLYVPILILGLISAAFAIFMAFKGLKTIMDSMFGKK
ncbi:hypothetical protein D1816_25010 [Aquimarina sp. AD10]|uniref:Uncharacterized protein n=1 Tax=Aquimarina aggregata TaxID=1642818 RepID=A0A162CVW6_9FLAO|nr:MULTISPECIES: DUF6095 family protein [Aquimarina]AXT63463.1 hypothetical protein D1816_25010 [Aquimarina sp. AD10]KZS41849.1 hypothetical protein AWE51_20865 [Aquimarina aggregata]RKM91606.1 hypothetical protein D7033_21995 [Aquimarina sp. AD10]